MSKQNKTTKKDRTTHFSGIRSDQIRSVAQSCPTLCDSMNHQHARPPCPSPTLRVYPNLCPLSRWCHPAISSSVVPFSSCPQSFPASGFFPVSQLFTWGGQSFGVSASSVLPMNTQDWSPLGWTGWISYPSLNVSWISCFSAPAQQYYSCAWERFWVGTAWLGAPVKEWRTREGTETGFVTEVVVRGFFLRFLEHVLF